MTLMWFDSLDDVRGFIGEDYEAAHVPARARTVLPLEQRPWTGSFKAHQCLPAVDAEGGRLLWRLVAGGPKRERYRPGQHVRPGCGAYRVCAGWRGLRGAGRW